jgi:thiol:disulfide interchange protein DsbD
MFNRSISSRRWRGLAIFPLLLSVCVSMRAQTAAQIVQWSIDLQPLGPLHAGTKASAALKATIKDGWHVYALSQGPGGPTPLSIKLADNPSLAVIGDATGAKPETLYDKNFDMQTEFYEHNIVINLPMMVKSSAPVGTDDMTLDVRFQTCNERTCLPPTTVHLTLAAQIVSGAAVPSASTVKTVQPETFRSEAVGHTSSSHSQEEGKQAGSIREEPVSAAKSEPLIGPGAGGVGQDVHVLPTQRDITAQGFGSFLWLAVVMGALSLLTPCVFPMIPITVSYFANHAGGSRRSSVAKAGVYAGGIILTFSAVGMLLAVLFGAGGVNRLASNPWVNLFITAVFLVFALSLFGAFFLQIPVGLTQRLDSLSRSKESSGTVGALLMGILFTLTSFTCTAPFVGTLLVMATQGNWRWPLAGMVAFSTVFAIPFFLLALAPQIVSSLPRAGGWMNSVKVVMGYLEIAAAMKFLSNADLVFGWGVFTRQAVLAIWVAVGLLVVLYLLGNFKMSHDSPVMTVTAPRTVFSIIFLSISIWLMTGLFGHSLGELEAFLPPPEQGAVTSATDGTGADSASAEPHWILNDYVAAKAEATKENKPIFIDFTGYTCTNCRWMEANMFPRPEIQAAMSKFVLVRLYTDGAGKLYEDQQAMQNDRFGTVALPLYVLLSKDGATISTFPGLTRNPAEFLAFLHKAPVN